MRRNTIAIWVLAAAAAAALPACPKDGDNPLDVTCDASELGTVSFAGECDVGAKLDAVLHATDSIVGLAESMANDVKTACDNIITDLGGTPPQATDDLAASVQASCDAANILVADTLNTALPVGASLAIEVVPGGCTVDIEAAAQCTADCDATVEYTPGTVECEPGQLVGTCSGTCSGECRGGCEGDIACTAHCTAECSGSCDATCNGTCDGTCSVAGANGQCAGTCDGTCTGSCSGSCTGDCSGTCEGNGSCSGSCSGECAGGCDVDYTAPHCEGTPPTMDADVDCEASCNAQASVEATCTPPTVTVTATIDGADQAQLDALIATLTDNLPALFEVLARSSGDLATLMGDYADSVSSAASGIADCGLKAVSCGAAAVSASVDAAAQINASVSVSVTVTASASASAEAQ